MSNRIRILFHSGADGSCHIGPFALAVLRTLAETAKAPVWVTREDWVRRGRPRFLDHRKTFITAAEIGENFLLPGAEFPPLKQGTVAQAKQLWSMLPDKLRQTSHLVITRENRKNCWRRSLTNPQRHGYRIGKQKAASTANPWYITANTVNTLPSAGSLQEFLDVGTIPVSAPTTAPATPAGQAYQKYLKAQAASTAAAKLRAQNQFYADVTAAPKSKPSKAPAKVKVKEDAEANTKEKATLRIGIWS